MALYPHAHLVTAMPHPQLQEILAQLRQGLEALYGDRLLQLILYGSQARGDARDDSDIDVLIVLQEPVDPSAEIKRTSYLVADLCLQYNVVISCVFAPLNRIQTEQSPFFMNVRREGVQI